MFVWHLLTRNTVGLDALRLIGQQPEQVNGSSTLSALLDGIICSPFKAKGKYYVHRLESKSGVYYLKRSGGESVRNVLRHFFRGRLAHTNVGWEFLAALMLKAHNFRVMNPIFFVEEFWFGFWPRRAAMLLEEVKGVELIDVIEGRNSSLPRDLMMYFFGEYIGMLHGAGIFHSPRVHDFIIQRESLDKVCSYTLTMIDVDLKGLLPVPLIYNEAMALNSLAQSCYLFLRVGHVCDKREMRKFVSGYKSGLGKLGHRASPKFAASLLKIVNNKLLAHGRSTELARIFPRAPSRLNLSN